MSGLLEALLGEETEAVERVRPQVGDDRNRALQAYSAAAGTILRGLEEKTRTKEGAESIWDLLRKHMEKGTLPANAPAEKSAPQRGVQVRDMDPAAANEIFKAIFGKDAPNVEGGFAKVITLDPETSRKVFEKVLPSVLGGLFGAAEQDPEDSPVALPKVVGNARREMEERQPNAMGIFEAIFDQNHDGKIDLEDLAGIFAPRKPR